MFYICYALKHHSRPIMSLCQNVKKSFEIYFRSVQTNAKFYVFKVNKFSLVYRCQNSVFPQQKLVLFKNRYYSILKTLFGHEKNKLSQIDTHVCYIREITRYFHNNIILYPKNQIMKTKLLLYEMNSYSTNIHEQT